MKQLTIFCSSDLAEHVRNTLIETGVDGFMEVPHAVGTRPDAALRRGRYPSFDAEMIIAATEDEQAEQIVVSLTRFIGCQEPKPCLRVLVAPLEVAF